MSTFIVFVFQTAEFALEVILVALALGIYFAPSLVATYREHRNSLAIGVLNAFLGWTVLGWVVALTWACTAEAKD